MFGCSDVYHWMGRTAKAVCLPDCGPHQPVCVLRTRVESAEGSIQGILRWRAGAQPEFAQRVA